MLPHVAERSFHPSPSGLKLRDYIRVKLQHAIAIHRQYRGEFLLLAEDISFFFFFSSPVSYRIKMTAQLRDPVFAPFAMALSVLNKKVRARHTRGK